jgi:hypothetical protein
VPSTAKTADEACWPVVEPVLMAVETGEEPGGMLGFADLGLAMIKPPPRRQPGHNASRA